MDVKIVIGAGKLMLGFIDKWDKCLAPGFIFALSQHK